ncbi:hypothetical protein Tco_0404975 [Tanacetum coccineum]
MLALLKILERHTADLIVKYFMLPGPEFIKNQESKKSPNEIIRIKREQVRPKRESHDSDEDEVDDDDEGPSVDQNKGRSARDEDPQSAASQVALNLLPKDDGTKSSKKTTDEGHVSDLENRNAHIPRCRHTTWFKRFQKAKRLLQLNQNGPSPRMISRNREYLGILHTPNVSSTYGDHASKEDVCYWVIIQMVMQNEQGRSKLCKANFEEADEAEWSYTSLVMDIERSHGKAWTTWLKDYSSVRRLKHVIYWTLYLELVDIKQVAVALAPILLEQNRNIESRAKRELKHPSEMMVFHNEDGNPARANIKQALGRTLGRNYSRIDDEVVQDQRQRDDNDLQDERQDQPKEEEFEPKKRKKGFKLSRSKSIGRKGVLDSSPKFPGYIQSF